MFGYFVQDDDSHWYFVPENLVGVFRNKQDEIACNPLDSESLIDEFIEMFDMYRLSGGVESIKIPFEEVNKYIHDPSI